MKERTLTPFGREVKKALIDRRMTQKELALALGVSPKYLNLIMHGERSGTKYISDIVKILDLNKKWYEKLIA